MSWEGSGVGTGVKGRTAYAFNNTGEHGGGGGSREPIVRSLVLLVAR